MKAFTNKNGLTLIEIIVVIAIFGIILLMGDSLMSSFNSVNKEEILNKEMLKIKSRLEEARVLTLASKAGTSYGVHFDTEQVVLFQGGSYSATDASNVKEPIDSKVNISSVILVGGGKEVKFQKVSGETDQSGSVTIALKEDASKNKNIIIKKIGLIIAQ